MIYKTRGLHEPVPLLKVPPDQDLVCKRTDCGFVLIGLVQIANFGDTVHWPKGVCWIVGEWRNDVPMFNHPILIVGVEYIHRDPFSLAII